jgi:hypothetical protein
VKFDENDVERVRRGKMNELEKIINLIKIDILYKLKKKKELVEVKMFRV